MKTSRKKVPCFQLQETTTFPDGAPQRESYDSDAHFIQAVRRYQEEWRAEYECKGCADAVCPQCGCLSTRGLRADNLPKRGMDFPPEHREAFDNGYLWGQESIVNTLLKDAKEETAEERAKYDGLMQLLKDSKMKHGTCKPRSRKACTACNAQEQLDALVAKWRGPFLTLSEAL